MPGIVEHDEVVLGDAAVAGVGRNHVYFAGADRRIHELRLHLPLLPERQPVGAADRRPFGPGEELVVPGDGE
jgi:hypothetical protein